MAYLVPYINFGDNTHEALRFYKDIFGGDAEVIGEGERVMHMDFKASDVHFMGGDHKDKSEPKISKGGNLVLNCDNEQQLKDFYNKLVAGGKEVFAPMDSGWGAIVAHCDDRFGVTWMLNYDAPKS